MSSQPRVFRRGERWRPIPDPPRPDPKVRASLLGLILAGLGVSLLAILAGVTGAIKAPIPLLGAGVLLLAMTKLAAFFAVGTRVQRRAAMASGDRTELIEACTLGSLLAFVISLALGRLVVLPRGLLLLDWAVSVAAICSCQKPRPRGDVATQPEPAEVESPVARLVRDRCVMVTGGDRKAVRALIGDLIALEPERVLLAVRRASDFPGSVRGVTKFALDPLDTAAVREAVGATAPDLLLFVPGRDDSFWEVALGARRVITAALRSGVETIAVIIPPNGSRAECLAERVARSLSGMTRSRLVCIRIGEDLSPSALASGVLRIAALARDGTVTTLGCAGVAEVGASPDIDASALWNELDRYEALCGTRRNGSNEKTDRPTSINRIGS